jgi:membrane fusion protein (multidrug efflux system)
MYAEVEWIESRRTSLVVPLVSVVDRGGQKAVFLAGEGLAQMAPITVGAVVGDMIEVLSGLKGDERVITTGAGQLNDKDKITLVEHPAARK